MFKIKRRTTVGTILKLLVTIDLKARAQLRILFKIYKKLRFLRKKFRYIILIIPLQVIDYLILAYFGLI